MPMKLFVFEPYNWGYCGGAIGIIADDFDSAVELVLKEDRKEAEERFNIEKRVHPSLTIEECCRYKKEYFSSSKEELDKLGRDWDNWLLTNEVVLSSQIDEPQILFNNWQYA